ncbi:MAG: glycogen debranching protein GlgX [Actinomycetaceae bacterium]|nr:glycogen debranching protein GlgX [Actinomycetaceae bacterium]
MTSETNSVDTPPTWVTSTTRLAPASVLNPDLGATIVHGGVDFAVAAPLATSVELCIFDSTAPDALEDRYLMNAGEGGVWSGHLPHVGAGTLYGFRANGRWDPEGAVSFNPYKLLLDPYGKGLAGSVELCAEIHGHVVDEDLEPAVRPLKLSTSDSAPKTARSVVVEQRFPVVPKPRIPWEETVIYELHVKGFTKQMPGVPEELRGTYAGLAHPASISHLKALGVTAIELLPIHAKWDEPFLTKRGLTNYWGYSTLSYFTPEPSYATQKAQARGAQAVLDEVRGMVSILHEHGIEVLLDVVYNHTCEGGFAGQTLSWRGLGQSTYYRHTSHRPAHMIDDTGCGNTVNFDEARVVQMTLDSLRYWSEDIGVDGFRFDLAVTLGRFATGFTPRHPFLVALAADPVLSKQKIIAEPWDIGPGGWQTGNFPLPWSEWNDRYRDTIRSFWLADFANLEAGRPTQGPNDIATRLAGSADLFSASVGHLRPARSSINFVTAHDGFTLSDLTTFNHKVNHDNMESNRDGTPRNLSWNHGIEGHTRAKTGEPNERVINGESGLLDLIFYARERSMRNLLATLLISTGTPMLVAGDEFGRTQQGNNNAYCQDSKISWLNWDFESWQQDMFDTTRYLLALRRIHPVMRPSRFATGRVQPGDEIVDLSWYTAENKAFKPENWHDVNHRILQMLRSGYSDNDSDLLVVFNGTLNSARVKLTEGRNDKYRLVFDSSWSNLKNGGVVSDAADHSFCDTVKPGKVVHMEPQSLQIYLTER